MSESNADDQREKAELSRLIEELEQQIESVNAGLSKIRGTVARISFAAFGSATPAPGASWSAPQVAPSPRGEWQILQSPPVREQAPPPADLVAPVGQAPAPPPTNLEASDRAEPVAEPESGFWDSVAEGASWPTSRAPDDAPMRSDADNTAWENYFTDPEPEHDEPESPGGGSLEDLLQVFEAALDHSNPDAGHQSSSGIDGPEQASSPAVGETMGGAEASTDLQPAGGFSSGWPDESAWSEGFEWPAMKDARATTPARNDDHVDISDIVAQVRAELEAASQAGIDISAKFADEGDTPGADAGQADAGEERREADLAVDSPTGRTIEGAFQTDKVEAGYAAEPTSDVNYAETAEDVREEVRRAVEATREELAGGTYNERPAFRLASPGAVPDWSTMQMEPSGPPVVVIKDTDGRVELASVYEALNELGCGDGAALLNYTPHSVTVGLPAASGVPSKERVAAAIEKVFGLAARVDSDGVRITVSIGAGQKRKSEDAA